MPPAPDLDALRAEALAAVERYAAAAFEAEPPFVPGESSVSVAGKVIGSPELRTLVDAALDGWLTEGRYADEFRTRLVGVTERPNIALVGSGSQANLLAVAAGLLAPARAPARRRRRGHHAGGRLPHHRRPALPARPAAGLRRRRAGHLQPVAGGVRRRHRPAHPRHHRRPLPRQPVRRARPRGAVPRARPRADRGLLRRARLAHRRAHRGHVRPRRDLLVLSRAPHDDGGGGRGGDVRPRVGPRRRLAARVGPRLLVPARRQRRLRPPLRGPLRRAPGRLRPQVRVLARGLQLQVHRHAGRTRGGADAPAGKLRGAPAGELRAPARRVAAARGALRAAASAAGGGAELVRLSAHAARGWRCRAAAGCRCTCSSSASTRGSCWPAT